MILVYNENGLNDVLLCILNKQDDNKATEIEKKNDLTIIKQDNKIIGINISNSKEKFSDLPQGVLLAKDEALEKSVLAYLEANDIILEANDASFSQEIVIGDVKEKSHHPDSNKLSVCLVDVAGEMLQIVCGAANVDVKQKVVVAKVGSMMPTGLVIEPSILRKVASNGMICSGKELALPEVYQTPGILVLAESAPVGELFFDYYHKEMVSK